MVLDRAHRPPGWGAWGRGPRRTPRPPARLTSPLTKPLCLRPSKRDLGLAPTRCEPGPASPSAFLWPLHCPGQTRCARAGWTQRRHGWTGPRARTRGSRPPGRWSLWRDCQGLDSAPPRHGYGYCSQGRTRLREEVGQTDGRREKKDQVGKKQEAGKEKVASRDHELGARTSTCNAAPATVRLRRQVPRHPRPGPALPLHTCQACGPLASLPSCPPPFAVTARRPPCTQALMLLLILSAPRRARHPPARHAP